MESKHDLRKQKKKLKKRKRAITSVTYESKQTSKKPADDSGDDVSVENISEDEDKYHAVKLVRSADTSRALDSEAAAEDEDAVQRPIIPFLEGKDTRSPAEVLAWMIAPMPVQQFFEFAVHLS